MKEANKKSKVTEQQLSSLLRTAHEEAATWERESYAKTNEGLYRVLGRCLEIYQQVVRDSALMEVLKQTLANAGMTIERSPTASKVIAGVFRSPDRRRTYVYSKVLREAERSGVTPAKLPAWIKKNGGIEAIRSKAGANANSRLTSTQAADFAARELAQISGTAFKERLSARFDSSVPAKPFAILIVRQMPGTKSVLVWGTAEAADVSRALAIAGRRLHAEARDEEDLANIRTVQRKREDNFAKNASSR